MLYLESYRRLLTENKTRIWSFLPPYSRSSRRGFELQWLVYSKGSKSSADSSLVAPPLQTELTALQTPISMTALYMHHNEKIFPNSHTFLPERWTDAPDGGRSLDRYLVSFSKGSRQCIGIKYV